MRLEDEVAEFVQQGQENMVDAKHIALLEEWSEGWIAGLQLTMLLLQDRSDTAAFFNMLNGNQRYIFDYLAEEVLSILPDNIRTFLLRTSILSRLCADVCNALTGGDDAQTILTQLVSSNMFIVPLDDKGYWYRYHHLFADTLCQHLRQEYAEQIPGLHLQASYWYERHELIHEALEHAMTIPTKAVFNSLQPLLHNASIQGRKTSAVRILLVQALALQMQGSVARAQTSLAQALALAEPSGFVRTFVDEDTHSLLSTLLDNSTIVSQTYISQLLAAFPAKKQSSILAQNVPADEAFVLYEPLSERELEILLLITAGCSNQEIANQLVIAISTLKTHINRMYAKLEVRSRTQAIARARKLKLL